MLIFQLWLAAWLRPVFPFDKSQPPEALTFIFSRSRGLRLFPDAIWQASFWKCAFPIWLAGGLAGGSGASLADCCCSNWTAPKHPRRIRSTSKNHSRSPLEIVPGHFKCIQRSYGCRFDCRIVFIHIIGFFVTFLLKTNLFMVQKMFASMSVQKSCYFILFLFWMLYIMKFFRFGILRSPLQPVSYIYKLLENKKQQKKENNKK